MVFIEVCPYASGEFDLSIDAVRTLSGEDRGFNTAEQVRQLLLNEAKPALVLVNGKAAIGQFEGAGGDRLRWDEVMYESESKEKKVLRHKQGYTDAGSRAVPIIGFPFLGAMAGTSHQFSDEFRQLGASIRDFITR